MRDLQAQPRPKATTRFGLTRIATPGAAATLHAAPRLVRQAASFSPVLFSARVSLPSGQRVGTDIEPALWRLYEMQPAGFCQPEDQARAGASRDGSFIHGQHRDRSGAAVTPEHGFTVAATDDKNALVFDDDLYSFFSHVDSPSIFRLHLGVE